jgi:hypothetical protein
MIALHGGCDIIGAQKNPRSVRVFCEKPSMLGFMAILGPPNLANTTDAGTMATMI